MNDQLKLFNRVEFQPMIRCCICHKEIVEDDNVDCLKDKDGNCAGWQHYLCTKCAIGIKKDHKVKAKK
jgi:hypothetical protein